MSELRDHWTLDPDVTFLNHGSFGACPRVVLAYQAELRVALERQPVRFMVEALPPLLDTARARVASFVGADPEGLAFVTNATAGVNTVLRSIRFAAGDELLVTDHVYQACHHALEYVAERARARIVVAAIPFPGTTDDAVVDCVISAVTPKTRLALLDHITSPTGLVLPIARLVAALAERGVDTLVDGAHAPGMVPLDLAALGAAYYTGNGHKWLCAPKGAAFLYVREDRRDAVLPLVISHGYGRPDAGKTRFRQAFDWMGTRDPTPWLCLPHAIDVIGGILDGGWPAVMARNRALALEARAALGARLGTLATCDEALVGSLATVTLPDGDASDLYQRLCARGFETQLSSWPAPPALHVRLSCQLYNSRADYDALGDALVAELTQGA